MEHAQVLRGVDATEQIAEDRECAGDDDREPGREAIQSVGQIHRIRARRRHKRHEPEIDRPGENPRVILEERQLGGIRRHAVRQRKHQQIDAQSNPERHLADQLPARDEPLRLAAYNLQIVVEKSDQSHPEGRHKRDDDVPAVEPRPQQRGHDGRQNDDQAAHRRRAALAVMTRRTLGPHDLTDLVLLQLPNDPRSNDEGEQQRGDGRARRAERDVVEEIEQDVLACERREQMIEHQVR